MHLPLQRKRRPRNRPIKTTGILVRTDHDACGIAEPLERYNELLACQLVGLYNAIHGLPPASCHTLARLKRLFHESEGLPASNRILLRPEYQWRYGFNHHTVYRRAPGTGRLLAAKGLYDSAALRWAQATRIVRVGETPRQEPTDHDAALSLLMSSLEITVRRRPELRFISHIKIIRNASAAAQSALNPLSLPVPDFDHTFPSGRCVEVTDAYLTPDALFGIQYPPAGDPDFRFFALEYDRGTEDVEPSGNLRRSSWLRKVLMYAAVLDGAAPVYISRLKIPNLFVLCVFADSTRMAHAMRVAAAHAQQPQLFLFKTVPPIDAFLNAAPLTTLLDEPWQRVGGTINIRTLDERR